MTKRKAIIIAIFLPTALIVALLIVGLNVKHASTEVHLGGYRFKSPPGIPMDERTSQKAISFTSTSLVASIGGNMGQIEIRLMTDDDPGRDFDEWEKHSAEAFKVPTYNMKTMTCTVPQGDCHCVYPVDPKVGESEFKYLHCRVRDLPFHFSAFGFVPVQEKLFEMIASAEPVR